MAANITTEEIENQTEGNSIAHALLLTPPYPQFKWSKNTQDIILSSFFWGYVLLQIPAGQLIHMFGARFILSISLMINGVAALIFPWATFYGGWVCASLSRIAQGLSQAFIFPGTHCMFGQWTPQEERGRLAGYAYGGQSLGLVIGLPITGYIATSPLGWPGVFRFFGLISCAAAGIVWWLCADNPSKHSKISEKERLYIEKNLGTSISGKLTGYIATSPLGWPGVFRFFGLISCAAAGIVWWLCADNPSKHSKISEKERLYIEKNLGTSISGKKPPVPWCQILKSPGLYAIMIAHIGQNFSQVTMYSEIPAFMDKIMHVNIKANGLLTALPFFAMFITNFFWSWLTDMLIVKKILSVTKTRKLANSLGGIPVAIGLVVLAVSPKNIYVVESLLITLGCFKVASHLGFQINHLDMSRNYPGTLMSITNFASNLAASLAPTTAALILKDVTSEDQWCVVFYVSATLLFFTNLFYVIFGTAERAEWDKPMKKQRNGLPRDSVEMQSFVTNVR